MKRAVNTMTVAEISTPVCPQLLDAQGKRGFYFTFLGCMHGPGALDLMVLT